MANNRTNVWARRKARRALVQATYQWQLSAANLSDIKAEFYASEALKKADVEFFNDMLTHVVYHPAELDDTYAGLLDRAVDKLDHVERAILRLAAAEFKHRIDVPYLVVIDEYVELAKTFGATDSHKYINGVLDKLAGNLRSIEVQAAGRG
ncbi:MAG: transcription antitermination factor NusB [bacterium]